MTVDTGCTTCDEGVYQRVKKAMDWIEECDVADDMCAHGMRDAIIAAAEEHAEERCDW